MAEHEVVHRNPLGEVVCSCGELFEPGTVHAYWDGHIARPAAHGDGRTGGQP